MRGFHRIAPMVGTAGADFGVGRIVWVFVLVFVFVLAAKGVAKTAPLIDGAVENCRDLIEMECDSKCTPHARPHSHLHLRHDRPRRSHLVHATFT